MSSRYFGSSSAEPMNCDAVAVAVHRPGLRIGEERLEELCIFVDRHIGDGERDAQAVRAGNDGVFLFAELKELCNESANFVTLLNGGLEALVRDLDAGELFEVVDEVLELGLVERERVVVELSRGVDLTDELACVVADVNVTGVVVYAREACMQPSEVTMPSSSLYGPSSQPCSMPLAKEQLKLDIHIWASEVSVMLVDLMRTGSTSAA